MIRIAFAFAVLAAAQTAMAAEPIGRIFFSVEQRAQLDALRAQKIVSTQVRDEPVPETVTYNGIVRRNDGKATVWINRQSLSEAELRGKQSVAGTISRNGQILLQSPQAANPVQLQLKVGQSAELLSGQVSESYQRPAAAETKKPAESPAKAAATAPALPKDVPPELLEALRQAAVRAREKTAPPPAVEESAQPAPGR